MDTSSPWAKQHMRPVSTLGDPHREIFVRAVTNILSSSIAKKTYAQIIDGLPLADVAWNRYGGCLCYHHPLLEEHKELCPGVTEETERMLSSFDAGSLLMPLQVRDRCDSSPNITYHADHLAPRPLAIMSLRLQDHPASRLG